MISAALIAVLLAAPGALVARGDGFAVSEADLRARAAALRALGRDGTLESVVNGLVAEELLSAEARRLGMTSSAELDARIDALVRQAAGVALLADVQAKTTPTESTLRAMFHASADAIAYESLVFATRELAATAAQQARRGGPLSACAAGATVARIYPSPADAPAVARRELDRALAEALFAAPSGALVGPIELATGWAIARALTVHAGSDAEFEARRPELTRSAAKLLAVQTRTHLVEKLKAAAKPTVDEAFLRSLDGAHATPQQLAHTIAVVNGRRIAYAEIHETIRALAAGGGHMAGPNVRIRAAWEEVDVRLLQDSAFAQGFASLPEVASRRPEFERIALAEAMAARIRRETPPVSEREIRKQYEANVHAYRGYDEARAEIGDRLTAQRREAAVFARIEELRKTRRVSVDRGALQRLASADQR